MSLFDYCIEFRLNIVIPKIGSNYESMVELIELLKSNGYEVHLTLIDLDRVQATKRALSRFKTSERYVPLSLIFDTYGNNPTITFYKIITHDHKLLKSYGIISTAKSPQKKLSSSNANPANLY